MWEEIIVGVVGFVVVGVLCYGGFVLYFDVFVVGWVYDDVVG